MAAFLAGISKFEIEGPKQFRDELVHLADSNLYSVSEPSLSLKPGAYSLTFFPMQLYCPPPN